MNDRPTPETDACISSTRGESIFDLCKKLERERDEARAAAAKWEAVALREASINGLRICGKEAAK